MKDQLKILMLEDNPYDVELIQITLKKANLQFEAVLVSTEEDYVNALEKDTFDIILSDHQLPQFSSLDAIRIRNQKNITTPFILITGTVSEEYAVTIIQEGASDYILKDRLKRLPTAIDQAIQKYKAQQKKIEAEKELSESNERFKYACKATSDAIWDWDLETDQLIWGEGFETLFGYELNGLEPTINSWISHIHPDDKYRVVTGIYAAINNGDETAWSDEYRYVKANGYYANVIDKGIFIKDPITNKPCRMVGAMQDITEVVKSNNDLRQFSFITSHNLNAPLSNLLAILNLIDYSTLTPLNLQMLEMMKISTGHLKETIRHLADILVIKNKRVDLGNVEIQKVIEKVKYTLYDELHKVEPEICLELQVPVIKTYKFYLESIFQNLFENSLKYRKPLQPLKIRLVTEKLFNNRTQITYTDNGRGIDLKMHGEKLFGMYQRFHDNDDGKGLGLFMVKTQVLALGGEIDVESEPGVGTTFLITL